jgi:hypothetical protein
MRHSSRMASAMNGVRRVVKKNNWRFAGEICSGD